MMCMSTRGERVRLTDDLFLVFDEERLGGGTEERDALASLGRRVAEVGVNHRLDAVAAAHTHRPATPHNNVTPIDLQHHTTTSQPSTCSTTQQRRQNVHCVMIDKHLAIGCL